MLMKLQCDLELYYSLLRDIQVQKQYLELYKFENSTLIDLINLHQKDQQIILKSYATLVGTILGAVNVLGNDFSTKALIIL